MYVIVLTNVEQKLIQAIHIWKIPTLIRPHPIPSPSFMITVLFDAVKPVRP